MRALPAQVEQERESRERVEEAFHGERAEKLAADQAAELRAQLEDIAAAGPIRALKLRAERAA